MDRDGDRDGDGFYEYATKAGSWGEKNQGWKDSGDAILYEDGQDGRKSDRCVEVQGCYYAAKQLMGLAFASVGEERRAAELLAQAERLKQRFNETFWMPEHQYFALALDPDKQLVRTIAADPGQCLVYGIIDDDKAEAVAARLMMPDLFSGWGVRTLSTRHPTFNPFAYHLGSVWPASNGMIGFGLKRYGFNSQLHRWPRGSSTPAEYSISTACRRSWAAMRGIDGTRIRASTATPVRRRPGRPAPIVLLVQSMLGLHPGCAAANLDHGTKFARMAARAHLSNIRIGNARVGLRFRRDAAGYTQHEIVDQQGPLRINRSPCTPPRSIGSRVT